MLLVHHLPNLMMQIFCCNLNGISTTVGRFWILGSTWISDLVQSRTPKTENPPGKQMNGPELFPGRPVLLPGRVSLILNRSFAFPDRIISTWIFVLLFVCGGCHCNNGQGCSSLYLLVSLMFLLD